MRVLSVGTFDLIHSGHVNLFKRCRTLANLVEYSYNYIGYNYTSPIREVIIGINTDEFVKRFKENYPVYNITERIKLVSAFSDVDAVVINDSEDLKPLILDVKPNFLVVGSDWAVKDYYAQIGVTPDWLDEQKITLYYVPYTQGVSTTILKERINAQ